ncbi:MAG: glycosyltransferase family 4 protein [Clostridiaceae bacterium]|nr:glycosyltransferase family 4 protein [Clostridiaceae bacterium]
MNILFLTVSRIDSIEKRGIYTDLLRYFIKEGNEVYIVSPIERKYGKETHLIEERGCHILKVKTLNIQKTHFIEKGIANLLLDYQYGKAIDKYFNNVQFDLILYSTPPITLTGVINRIKKRYQIPTYLMLKDIFPQNAIDLGMMREGGLLHRYFRKKEEKLYKLSDYIGCMSPANVDYVLKHNPTISAKRVEVCPNSLELSSFDCNNIKKKEILNTYQIPIDRKIFIYGGNLGKPQGIDFLLKVLDTNKEKEDRYFLIVGSGTEYSRIDQWFKENRPGNAKLIPVLPKNEYDELVRSCDVGLIFLDPRFTIPNYPSRLLSYMECRMPILMATDVNTDIGKIAKENGYGVWTENGNLDEFNSLLDKFCNNTLSIEEMGEKGYQFLLNNYTVENCYNTIKSHF